MEIYLSSETEGRADSLLLPIRNMVDSLLDDIRKNEYGSALTSVGDRKSTRLNSSHDRQSRMPSSA